ncbi:MAG: hypothetical protein WA972_12835 [Rhodococcus qingshengii]
MTVLEEIVMSEAGLLGIIMLCALITLAAIVLIDWLAAVRQRRADARRERAAIRRELAIIRRAEHEAVTRILTAYDVALSEIRQEGRRAS